MICKWSSRCHCHPIISCFIKIWKTGLTFLVLVYPGCLGKEAVKRVSVTAKSRDPFLRHSVLGTAQGLDDLPVFDLDLDSPHIHNALSRTPTPQLLVLSRCCHVFLAVVKLQVVCNLLYFFTSAMVSHTSTRHCRASFGILLSLVLRDATNGVSCFSVYHLLEHL